MLMGVNIQPVSCRPYLTIYSRNAVESTVIPRRLKLIGCQAMKTALLMIHRREILYPSVVGLSKTVYHRFVHQ